jgi:Domain of Unknown Function with PDB structure (DUF3857)/Transglutaminase-like superfamily
MKLYLSIIFIACVLLCNAQKPPIKFGEIPMEDMKMTSYESDSSAAAVILADFGEVNLMLTNLKESLEFERHVRIKILKKSGLDWATASILMYHSGSSEDRVTKLKATSYNMENGKIVETKMNKENIFKEKFNRNYNIQKFTLPNVKVGSVIEYSYTVSSDFLSRYPNWQFQYDIPARHSEYRAAIPDFFIMEKYMQGYLGTTSYEVKERNQVEYAEKIHQWVIKDVPAFKTEPDMTCEDDYVSKINFALAFINFPGQPTREIMGSWEKLNKSLLEYESFGRIIEGAGYLKKVTEEVVGGETDPMKKIEKIFNYVRNTIAWDNYEDYLSDKPKEVFEKKKGTSGDINLILGSMLHKAGISVDMVMLSTRDHGFVREQYPMERQFNYVICAARIDGKPILLDATDRFLPAGVLPERCLNGKGLMISKNFHGWIPLETKAKDAIVVNAELAINPSFEMTGKISISSDGYAGASVRKKFLAMGESGYAKGTIGKKENWQIAKSSFENIDENTKAVKETHEITINDHVTASGDVIYLNPLVTNQIMENPYKMEDRVYPVDFGYLRNHVYIAKITLPEGYVVDELPQNKIFALPGSGGKFSYSLTPMGNFINVMCSFQINRQIFIQTEYPALREFYNLVVAKQAEQIVLKKK